MKKKYDLIAIGAGAGGLGVAIGMAKFGFKVLLIDKDRSNFGGDCLNSGCIPSKALLHIAQQIADGHAASQFGLHLSGRVDLRLVLDQVRAKQALIRSHESAEYLQKEEGIEVAIGTARFIARQQVQVNDQVFEAKKILVATGSKPRTITIPGQEHLPCYTNENLFHMEHLPHHLLILGAGPIGVEMGQAFRRLGAKVSLIDRGSRILNKERPEVSALLQRKLEEEGIEFYLNAQIAKVDQGGLVKVEHQAGKSFILEGQALLFAMGRTLNYQTLNLPAAGVQMDQDNQWPLIDQYLRAKGNRHIVFAGDAAHNLLFSHAAELHTSVLLTNFFSPWPFKKKFKTDDFSWVTFTKPEVATFGLNEREIKKAGISYEKLDFDFDRDDRAITNNYQYGKLILFTKKNFWNPRNGKILGGTVVAPQAGEMIQELILAKQEGLGVGALFNKVYPYPTQTRVHKIALVEKFGSDISSGIKKLLRVLYH